MHAEAGSQPGAFLTILLEANVTERKPHREIVQIPLFPFEFTFRESKSQVLINGVAYDPKEGGRYVKAKLLNLLPV